MRQRLRFYKRHETQLSDLAKSNAELKQQKAEILHNLVHCFLNFHYLWGKMPLHSLFKQSKISLHKLK